jgi:hypothetical protein
MLDDLREQIGAWLSDDLGLPAIAILEWPEVTKRCSDTDKQTKMEHGPAGRSATLSFSRHCRLAVAAAGVTGNI